MNKNNIVYLALGANIGDREHYLYTAIEKIANHSRFCLSNVSKIYETVPVGYITQEKFLNMVIKVETGLTPQGVLREIQKIESNLKRERKEKWGPRTIDIDILLYNELNIIDQDLTIPHERMFERAFVLVPLSDVIGTDKHKIFEEAKKCDDFMGVKFFKNFYSANIKGQKISLITVDSTNKYVKELANNGAMDRTVVVADNQTNGRGRLGRNWESDNNEGVWMSILYRKFLSANELVKIPIIIAISIVEAIYNVTGIQCFIKWPNDIILDNKKVGGILCESSFENKVYNFVVVGIGINVNQVKFSHEINKTAISLRLHSNNLYDKNDIVNEIIKVTNEKYDKFINGEFPDLIKRYRELCINLGKEIKVRKNSEDYIGVAISVSDSGNLIVKYNNDQIEELESGEVSVRGLEGYI